MTLRYKFSPESASQATKYIQLIDLQISAADAAFSNGAQFFRMVKTKEQKVTKVTKK